MAIESIASDFESHSEVEFVKVEGSGVTVMFNPSISSQGAKPTVESIVFDKHGLSYGDDVFVTSLPDSVKRDDADLVEDQYAVIIEER